MTVSGLGLSFRQVGEFHYIDEEKIFLFQPQPI